MIDRSDPRRDRVHEVLQELGPQDIEKHAVLVGWALVCDWMDEDGERWLTKCHSASIPTWSAAGMHHDALNGHWPSADDDEDDDE